MCDVLFFYHNISSCIIYDIIASFRKIKSSLDVLPICCIYKDSYHHLLGLPKHSAINYLDIIGWMSDIFMHSVSFLNEAIKSNLVHRHDARS